MAAEKATLIDLVELLDEALILPKLFFVREILLRHSRVGGGKLVELVDHLVEPAFISLGLRMGVKKNEDVGHHDPDGDPGKPLDRHLLMGEWDQH